MAKKRKLDSEELKEILRAERDYLYSNQALYGETTDKWEQVWDSSKMVAITPERLAKFPHPIPLKGLDVLPATRIWSRLLDYFFVGFGLFVLDSLGGVFNLTLTNVAKTVFGDLGLKPGDYQYSCLIDSVGREILYNHPNVAAKIILLGFLMLLVHRILFYLLFNRTLGQMFAGAMITGQDGRFPSLGSRLIKAVATTIADASIIGNVVDLVFYLIIKPHVTATDAISGIRAVRYDEWKTLVARLMDRMNLVRKEGGLG
jgi:hypothetical protein